MRENLAGYQKTFTISEHFGFNPPESNARIADQHFDAAIVFLDGTIFYAKSFADSTATFGELCFTTAPTGYEETITDPSYSGQILIFSSSHIGNTGINYQDIESTAPKVQAIILQNEPSPESNWQSKIDLASYLRAHKIPAFCNVDTRALITKIRTMTNSNVGLITFQPGQHMDTEDTFLALQNFSFPTYQSIIDNLLSNPDRTQQVKAIARTSGKHKIAFVDFGTKFNILRLLSGFDVDIYIIRPDTLVVDLPSVQWGGVVLSNAPSDPREVWALSQNLIRHFLDLGLPTLGICMGHQILALALGDMGFGIEKMTQGHRGINHPVKNLRTGQVEITSQNHGYAVTHKNPLNNPRVSHISLFDSSIAGLDLPDKKILSVQFHPEASPGTSDSCEIFKRFMSLCETQNL